MTTILKTINVTAAKHL